MIVISEKFIIHLVFQQFSAISKYSRDENILAVSKTLKHWKYFRSQYFHQVQSLAENVKEVSRHKRKCSEKSIKVLNFNDARKLSQSDHRAISEISKAFQARNENHAEPTRYIFIKNIKVYSL